MQWYKQNTLLIEVYYERMDYEVNTETPAYTVIYFFNGDIYHKLGGGVVRKAKYGQGL